MKVNQMHLAPLLVLMLAAGCQRDSQSTNSQPDRDQAGGAVPQPAPEPAVEVPLPGKRVNIATGDGKKGKHVLQVGEETSGTFASPQAGAVLGIAVKIGTFSNRPANLRSDGILTFKACLRESCSTGTADLASAKDNALLDFNLDNPIQAAVGDGITYTLRKDSGTNPVVIWTFPLRPDKAIPAAGDRVETGMAPKISLRYSSD